MWRRLIQAMSWQRWRAQRIARRNFQAQHLELIAAQIGQSEAGHSGEVVVAIEVVSPLHEPDSQLRAREVFGRLDVWDTPQNSGVLLYIALDRRRIELIADRGISASAQSWQKICAQLQSRFAQQDYLLAVIDAVAEIEQVLRQTAPALRAQDLDANHLQDAPVVLSS